MDEELDRLVIRVRADTATFARDVQAMRGALDGPLEAGAERAGRAVEGALARAIRTGKLGFEDLKRVALSVLAEIAAASVRDGLGAVLGGGGGGGGLVGLFGGLVGGAGSGFPGRATGGPVSPGRAYVVGERGPELFVPSGSGRVVANGAGGGAREVRVAITVDAGPGVGGAEALTRSGRQVARAVRRALSEE